MIIEPHTNCPRPIRRYPAQTTQRIHVGSTALFAAWPVIFCWRIQTPSPGEVRGICLEVRGTALELRYLWDEDGGGGGEGEINTCPSHVKILFPSLQYLIHHPSISTHLHKPLTRNPIKSSATVTQNHFNHHGSLCLLFLPPMLRRLL